MPRTAGPVFKIGTHYLRTMIEDDGVRTVHPKEMEACWPKDAPGPQMTDPEVEKLMAWMRQGKMPEQPEQTPVRKIPTAVTETMVVSVEQALHLLLGSAVVYCRLFDVLDGLWLSDAEGREFVVIGALRLSAEREDATMDQMLVRVDDLREFVATTGHTLAPKVLN